MAQPPKKTKAEKDFKKGDIVTWNEIISHVTKKYVGEVLFVVKPNKPVENIIKKMNRYMTRPEVVGMEIQFQEKMKKKQEEKKEKGAKKETKTSRPVTSYIVTIKDGEGRDVLYWPRNRKLQLVA